MKRFIIYFIFSSLGVFVLFLAHCGTRVTINGGLTPVAPGLIHVTNGQTVGFYNSTGAYGFGTQGKSVLSLGASWGNSQPFAQNNTSGAFYFGTNNASSSNYVIYFSALKGAFTFTTLNGSRMPLQVPGTSSGVAASNTSPYVYVADSINDVITYLSPLNLSYGISGTSGNSIFAAPMGLGANYINVSNNMVVVTETQIGSAYFMNASNGNAIGASGGRSYLSLVNASTGCNSAGLVNEVQVNSVLNTAFILCGPSVIYLNLGLSSPNYFMGGSLLNSTFVTAGITSPRDIVYDSGDSSVIVVGGSKIISLDAQTGALTNSADLLTYNCSTGISLAGVTYSPATKQIYATDSANSDVYILNSSSFSLSTGVCGSSVFTTLIDVPNPTKIGFF